MIRSAEPQEIELKLRLPATAVRRLSAHPLLRGVWPVSRRLYTIYYDTPDFELKARGVALRLRREGKRWMQTLKGGGRATAGLHRRLEIERAVAGQAVDWDMLAAGPYADLFSIRRLQARLRPVFATRFVRSERRLEPAPGLVIDAAVDRGAIVGGRRSEPLCELELELKAGRPAALYEFAQRLARRVPLAIENRTKAERGYALKAGEVAQPVKARGVLLEGGATVDGAFRSIGAAALDHLQANAAGVLAGEDPEYVHQMRVALRRMRSAFRLFAPVLPEDAMTRFVEEMRWLAGALGPARDWDVFVDESLPQFSAKIREPAARAALEKAAKRMRRHANRTARRTVGSSRYRLFTLSLAGWIAASKWADEPGPAAAPLARPVLEFAAETLDRRRARVRKRGRKLASRTPGELHRLRIAIKQLRYAADFFSGLYAKEPARRMLRQLSGLQDILGAMNDAAQAERLIAVCDTSSLGGVRAAAGRALETWNRKRMPALRRKLTRAWAAFRAQARFW